MLSGKDQHRPLGPVVHSLNLGMGQDHKLSKTESQMERVTASDPSPLEFKFSFSPGHKQKRKSSLVFITCKGQLNKNDNMKK